MSKINSGLKPINELLKLDFFIPSYQRGYRWTTNQVKDLLNDIWEFHRKEDKKKGEFYCLQPIVVMQNENGTYIVIDGQQRLTTIHIILTYLSDILQLLGKKKYSIHYETREGSAEFLEHIDCERRSENIDYFHICQAYDTVKEWFNEKDGTVKLSFFFKYALK